MKALSSFIAPKLSQSNLGIREFIFALVFKIWFRISSTLNTS